MKPNITLKEFMLFCCSRDKFAFADINSYAHSNVMECIKVYEFLEHEGLEDAKLLIVAHESDHILLFYAR